MTKQLDVLSRERVREETKLKVDYYWCVQSEEEDECMIHKDNKHF